MNEESLRLHLHHPAQEGAGAVVEGEGEEPEQGRIEELTGEEVEEAGLG